MKLVICYSTGEYDSHENHNICFECESKDKFYEKFIESVDKYFSYKEKHRELSLNIFEARESTNPAKKSNASKEFVEFFDKFHEFLYHLIIDNCKFPIPNNDIIDNKMINLPEVYTLDEWFDVNKVKESFTSI